LIDSQDLVTDDPIAAILSGEFVLTETGRPFSCPIQDLVIDVSLDGQERDLIGKLGLDGALAIVCDSTIYDILGSRISKAFPSAVAVVLDHPNPDEASVTELTARTRHADALIAVGSGTMNDIVKITSHRRQSDYVIFATAPSMNGYVTATASITVDGQKLSLPAKPPLGVFFDLTVLADAPMRLIRAGVGDSLCRSTAEVDWYLSHHLFDTPFLETPFAIQAADEADLLARLSDLKTRDIGAIRALVRLLILGGLGMLITGNSQPGSQGEHLISHYIDMLAKPHPGSLHGEQVGLATLTMSALRERLLRQERPPDLSDIPIDFSALAERFGANARASEAALRAKTPVGSDLDLVNRRLEAHWPVLRTTLSQKALPFKQLDSAFAMLGVARQPENLGLSRDFYREAVLHAHELRDRFTLLDLATMAGTIEPFVDEHLPS
jgi:glycerol-1-phosphate dehydrogenase [NAD(P)+]